MGRVILDLEFEDDYRNFQLLKGCVVSPWSLALFLTRKFHVDPH